MSAERRKALLQWAIDSGAWIIEDDYLSEFQLNGRTSPALAAEDMAERVIHIGSFGKTLSPALGLGFVVAPISLAERFGEVAACLQPAPNTTTQLALASFIADGHYLRHLRHMKRLYTERRDGLLACLRDGFQVQALSGLAVIVDLPEGIDDRAIARMALQRNIAPMPLSPWWHSKEAAQPGLLLGVTNIKDGVTEKACQALREVIAAVNG
jgi:GntR family transcriptional regulator/MocR family aminotransferase